MISAFLWVLGVEMIQNFPFVIGVIVGRAITRMPAVDAEPAAPSILRGIRLWPAHPNWSGLVPAWIGCALTAIIIVITEPLKTAPLIGRPPASVRLFDMVALSVIFGIIIVVFWAYESHPWRRQRLVDFSLCVAGGSLVALAEIVSVNERNWQVITGHVIAFMLTAFALLEGFRWASAPERRSRWGHVVLVNLVMSLIIVIVDYGPFLPRVPLLG